jgi:hypothetical protein
MLVVLNSYYYPVCRKGTPGRYSGLVALSGVRSQEISVGSIVVYGHRPFLYSVQYIPDKIAASACTHSTCYEYKFIHCVLFIATDSNIS